MTKGIIVENLGAAEYTVRLEPNVVAAEARVAVIEQRLLDIVIPLAVAQAEEVEARAALADIQADIDLVIDTAHGEGRPVTLAEIKPLVDAAAEQSKEVLRAQAKVNGYIAERAALSKEKVYLEGLITQAENFESDIWCADYIDDLPVDAEVAVVTVPGQNRGNALVIKPAYEDAPSGEPGKGAAWDGAIDGQLTPSFSQSPSGVFYNWALLPGWQKWKPTYRYGTVQNLSGDTCNVVLDDEVSSAQGLNVNQTTILTDVPIDYMTCNGAAFEDGDRVVVYFNDQEWSNGVVVGFETNPKQCPGGFLCIPASTDFPNGIGGAGAISLFTYSAGSDSYSFTAVSNLLAHNVNWFGPANEVISWRGSLARALPPNRVPGSQFTIFGSPPPGYTIGIPDPASENGGVYQWAFIRFITSYGRNGAFIAGPGDRIVGAALTTAADDTRYIVIVTTDNGVIGGADPADDVWRRPANDNAAAWELIGSWSHPTRIGVHDIGWFFNESGNEAACVLKDFTPVSGSPLVWFNRLYVLTVDIDTPDISVAESVVYDGLTQTTEFVATCDGTPGSGDHENATADTTTTYDGEQILAVDYQGDTRVVCTHRLSGQDTRHEEYHGSDDSFWQYQNGLLSIVSVNGNELTLLNNTDLTDGINDTEDGGDSYDSTETITGESVSSIIYYLDLRFDEALYLQTTRTFNQTRTQAGVTGPVIQIIDDDVAVELRLLSSVNPLEESSYAVNEENESNPGSIIGPGSFCIIDESEDIDDITVEVDHGDNSGFQQIMQIDVYGNRFVSIDNDIEDTFPAGYTNFLTNGDPVALSGLTGDNPSFWPLTIS